MSLFAIRRARSGVSPGATPTSTTDPWPIWPSASPSLSTDARATRWTTSRMEWDRRADAYGEADGDADSAGDAAPEPPRASGGPVAVPADVVDLHLVEAVIGDVSRTGRDVLAHAWR